MEGLLIIYMLVGLLLYASCHNRNEAWPILFVWPYVIYTPEGREWFDKRLK